MVFRQDWSKLSVLPIGLQYEENKLRRQFGTEYEEYAKRVKRLIPGYGEDGSLGKNTWFDFIRTP
jgi:hypothetical protein